MWGIYFIQAKKLDPAFREYVFLSGLEHFSFKVILGSIYLWCFFACPVWALVIICRHEIENMKKVPSNQIPIFIAVSIYMGESRNCAKNVFLQLCGHILMALWICKVIWHLLLEVSSFNCEWMNAVGGKNLSKGIKQPNNVFKISESRNDSM